MENNTLPSVLVKRLEAQVSQILRSTDPAKLDIKERNILIELRQNLNDARIYASAYETDETPEEQATSAKTARKWLAKARRNVLAASEYNVFSAIDVAHLSAQIEQIIDILK